MKDRIEKYLEVYSLTEILEAVGLTDYDVIEGLQIFGTLDLDTLELPEPV